MILKSSIERRVYQFKIPAGTSRGTLTEKYAWIIKIWNEENPAITGIGEISVIPGLTPEFHSIEQFEAILQQVDGHIENDWSQYSSIKFGIESALLDLRNGGKRIYFDNEFSRGQKQIPINGLIWMGDFTSMKSQVDEKINLGFNTIKVKVGAIDFEEELALLKYIREQSHDNKLTLRVDANGAFADENAIEKLYALSQFNLHSIEQPIKAGSWNKMNYIIEKSPIPIALDEELIGISSQKEKIELLETIKPDYIILKPSLHDGISGCQEWIELAEERKIGWWMTSALESNIGLEVICQLTGNYNTSLAQGLGTGSLYVKNEPTNLTISSGKIYKKIP